MRKITSIVLLLAAYLLTGCAGFSSIVTEERQRISSAHIGCDPASISIVNTGNTTWTASCKQKLFYCTVAPSASCKESIQ